MFKKVKPSICTGGLFCILIVGAWEVLTEVKLKYTTLHLHWSLPQSLVRSHSNTGYLTPQGNPSGGKGSCIVLLNVLFSNSCVSCCFWPFLIPQAFEPPPLRPPANVITMGYRLSMSPLRGGAHNCYTIIQSQSNQSGLYPAWYPPF